MDPNLFNWLITGGLSLSCIMLENGQTYFKNIADTACLTIFQHYALKG